MMTKVKNNKCKTLHIRHFLLRTLQHISVLSMHILNRVGKKSTINNVVVFLKKAIISCLNIHISLVMYNYTRGAQHG